MRTIPAEDVERSFKNIINWMNNKQRRHGCKYKDVMNKVKENMTKLTANSKEKFKEELIELLWNHQLEVSKFLEIVNDDNFWVDSPNKKLIREIKKGLTQIHEGKGLTKEQVFG